MQRDPSPSKKRKATAPDTKDGDVFMSPVRLGQGQGPLEDHDRTPTSHAPFNLSTLNSPLTLLPLVQPRLGSLRILLLLEGGPQALRNEHRTSATLKSPFFTSHLTMMPVSSCPGMSFHYTTAYMILRLITSASCRSKSDLSSIL